MILGPITFIDCIVFVILLAPQLIIHAGLYQTVKYASRSLPFLVLYLPTELFKSRYLTRPDQRPRFFQHATVFQEVMIRTVKYAFSAIPPHVTRVFLSKGVALPFTYFRMWRHGYLRSPVHWEEVRRKGLRGLWMIGKESAEPDIVIYYCHGGGFSMGSAYFYMEFLFTWLDMLKNAGYNNPAIFALEYSLVPDEVFPVQLEQTVRGYQFVLSRAQDDASRVCVAGDSAGGTLILSFLLYCSSQEGGQGKLKLEKPGLAVVLSPWVTLVSSKNIDTASDYLTIDRLHSYAKQYAGISASVHEPLLSPGRCEDLEWWKRASPRGGFVCVYGSEEVFQPEIRHWLETVRRAGSECDEMEEKGGVHVWPVIALFVGESQGERVRGLREIVRRMRGRMMPREKL
ncbi:hypothetical protein AJ80_01967 [Polytolypa hystricis UAMH7299]|uniref:Alpha/beta hydrolase fold-3 domain-containing protein n=1 Tax=Polytolypa hystricis (strain UAMH7299) TaxID=1447883 RepID=A0A2B7YRG1_POLH7|nr:hypothetical protein AJ80_01967 [Polytolypa hystricis UAMH7299]